MIREQLGSGPPNCVAARSFLSAEFGRCYRNGKRAVLAIWGSVLYGFISGDENRLCLTGKLHAVGPEGLHVDVTPKPDGKKLIPFCAQECGPDFFLERPNNRRQWVFEPKPVAVARLSMVYPSDEGQLECCPL
jgi:hypothetical protein